MLTADVRMHLYLDFIGSFSHAWLFQMLKVAMKVWFVCDPLQAAEGPIEDEPEWLRAPTLELGQHLEVQANTQASAGIYTYIYTYINDCL